MRSLAAALFVLTAATAQNPGYSDTPLLPDGRWHVHDKDRPHPPVVTPAPAGIQKSNHISSLHKHWAQECAGVTA